MSCHILKLLAQSIFYPAHANDLEQKNDNNNNNNEEDIQILKTLKHNLKNRHLLASLVMIPESQVKQPNFPILLERTSDLGFGDSPSLVVVNEHKIGGNV